MLFITNLNSYWSESVLLYKVLGNMKYPNWLFHHETWSSWTFSIRCRKYRSCCVSCNRLVQNVWVPLLVYDSDYIQWFDLNHISCSLFVFSLFVYLRFSWKGCLYPQGISWCSCKDRLESLGVLQFWVRGASKNSCTGLLDPTSMLLSFSPHSWKGLLNPPSTRVVWIGP